MATHHLRASVETVHWGYFDAALAPVLAVASGDTVTIDTVSGGPETTPAPGSGFHIPAELPEIQARVPRKLIGHMCTGPVRVEGAKAGGVLQVDILAVEPRQDWGYNFVRPLSGALPNDFDELDMVHIPLDLERKVGRLSWGAEVPLRPFFGVMATAPPKGWGMISTLPPRKNGGNLDNKELVAGTTLYLPVFNDGALFSVGDGHGAQGDGEVCVTAIEMALSGTFRLTARNDLTLALPRAETPTHVMTMAFDPDLDTAAREALRDMIALIGERKGLSRADAYRLCSLAADLRVTQNVNGNNGIHVMLERRYVT
jgi:acetamidase/formamidase